VQLDSLHIEHFRCIPSCDLELSPGINCLVGDNTAGKTSVLEAIYILGRGQSFRQNALGATIQENHPAAILRTRFRDDQGRQHRIGGHIKRSGHEFKFDDQTKTRRFDLIKGLPLQHIDPNIHRLLEQGPKYRRHFLDWGVFHVEQSFFPAWRRYRRALKQRNHALRSNQSRQQITIWDEELVQQGELIDACRRRYLEQVKALLPEQTRRLVGDDDLTLAYSPGWRSDTGLGHALARSLDRDLRSGFTQEGPHRADIRISIASFNARDWVSRGQQKLLTAALVLTQTVILQKQRGIEPILLLDDMAAELGDSFRSVLAKEIKQLGIQCFLSFLGREQISEALHNTAMFHVEQGRIKALE
jgi:DNA replication and repair protein RecF